METQKPTAATSADPDRLNQALESAGSNRRDLRRLGYIIGGLAGAWNAPTDLFWFRLLFGALLGATLVELVFYLVLFVRGEDWRALFLRSFDRDRIAWIGLGMLAGALLGGGIFFLLYGKSRSPLAIIGAIAGAGCLGTLASNLALTTCAPPVREASIPRQRVFARFMIAQTAVLTLFVLELGLSYLKDHPAESMGIQLVGGVFALELADIKPLKKFMRYALMLDPLGIPVGLPLGAIVGALLGYAVGGSFPVVKIGFGAIGIASYFAMECAEYIFARRNAPDTLEASTRALWVRIIATTGGLALGMIVGDHWRNPWTIFFAGAAGVVIGFWSVTIYQSFTDNQRKIRAGRS